MGEVLVLLSIYFVILFSGWFGWTESKVDDKQTYEKAKNKPKVEKGSSLSLRYVSIMEKDG